MTSNDRFTVVLFGATGDLALRKLLPALFHISKTQLIGDFAILATGRSQPDAEAYRAMARQRIPEAEQDPEAWQRFEECIEYARLDVNDDDSFASLHELLKAIETKRGFPKRRLFYLSVGPELFGPITDRLARSGALTRCEENSNETWSRLVIEKPFGHSLRSARELDDALKAHVNESQIYRIDHYLGKETVQNLIAFRFANGMIEPLWNSHHIASVQITVSESIGVGTRAGYYDSSGALRDMVQNHMMQLLALTAMEAPLSIAPDDIRNEKLRVLRSIRVPATPEEVAATTVRGQYGPGYSGDHAVTGYRDESGVGPESRTPTYVAARVELDSWRWTGVPFYLRHGKRLAERTTEIAVRFRMPPMHLFQNEGCSPSCPNVLTIRIQPDESIDACIGAKRPGPGMNIDPINLGFSYASAFDSSLPEAYERLLLDAISGDPTLFIRQDEVEASWTWADAVLDGWDRLPAPAFPNYAPGSDGPEDASRIFLPLSGPRNVEPEDGWRPLRHNA